MSALPTHGPLTEAPPHVHEWERGAHMVAAFGVDGRRYYCAICAVPYWCMAVDDYSPCDIHGGYWPKGQRYCDNHGPAVRWVP